VQIKRALDKIPGGMLIIPLLIGSIIRTISPTLPNNTLLKNSFTGGLMFGTVALLGAFYVCLGSTIQLRSAGNIMKKGVSLLLGKILVAALMVLLIKWLVPDQNHMFLGLSALAVAAALSDTNGTLYMTLMSQFGKKEDVASYSIMSMESGPFFTMLILGISGLASFPLQAFVYSLIPLVIGVILGNLDNEMRAYLSQGINVLIPFLALTIGFSIDFKNVILAGAGGIVLGLAVIVITGIVLIALDKLTGGNGVAGVAAASTAGNAALVPVTVAAAYAGYHEVAATATIQVATAVIITVILIPFLTAWYARMIERKKVQQPVTQTREESNLANM
jgi:2-keto-3-deoxygluconate permease